ncbi:MAG: hypothetical protein HDP34_05030 [Clostridia bacterium]|nr:hypothetical protein [Clostridia bacterium]
MKTYLLSAAGVIFLSVIISLLIPEGKLNKTVTFVMRLICIAVLIQPITTIFKISDSQSTTLKTDYGYVASVYSEHQSGQLENLLITEFNAESDCRVSVEYQDGEFKVTETCVKLENEKLIEEIYAYLQELGYINITVYAEST